MEGPCEKREHGTRFSRRDLLEALIAEQAFLQHGVISLSQLRDFGLSAIASTQASTPLDTSA
jgi:hypothetical protein